MATENMEPGAVLVSFGVGCFHFGCSSTALDGEFDAKQYVKDVHAFISEYAGVENIRSTEIQYTSGQQEIFEFDDEGGIQFGSGIYPWPVHWALEFTIHIPSRVQQDIMEDYQTFTTPNPATKYKVMIYYEEEFPVAFVSGVDATLSSPNDAVVLIRKYLEKFSPIGKPVDFQMMGPSPFHADFFIEESTEDTFRINRRAGYDDVIYSITKAENVEDRLVNIEKEIAQELGLYYRLIQASNQLALQWSELSNQIEGLASSMAVKQPWWQRLLDLVKVPTFNQISIELVQYELSVEHHLQHAKNRMGKLFIERGLDRFSEFIEDQIEELRSTPIEKFRRILNIVQDHDKLMVGYKTVLVAALIGILGACLGGVAGALVTISKQSIP